MWIGCGLSKAACARCWASDRGGLCNLLSLQPFRHPGKEPLVHMPTQNVPSFCSHEHWGSVGALAGGADNRWGATPQRPTGLADLILDPYFGSLLREGGWDWEGAATERGFEDAYAWGKDAPDDFFQTAKPYLERHRLTGAYQTLRQGILHLYDVDLRCCDGAAWRALDAEVEKRYAGLFEWYEEVRGRARFTECIRPMNPGFFYTDAECPSALQERAFMRPMIRIDPLLWFWAEESAEREALAASTGIEPVDAESWRAFIAALFEAAEAGGAVGSKQLQGYMRTLDFPDVEDGAVVWRGALEAPDVKVFQDWVVNRCMEETVRRGWVHQCHTGAANPKTSNPRPLADLAARYPGLKLVLLHCWPFFADARDLAKRYPNVYLDPCWLTVLNPESLRDGLREWLGAVPLHKITCGHDATSIEMAVGSVLLARRILAEVLEACAGALGIVSTEIPEIAHDILHNNAVNLYGIGEIIRP